MRAFLLAFVFTLAPAPFAAAAEGAPPAHLAASLPKLDAAQRLEAGQVVGLFGGGLSLSTAGAARALVVGAPDGGETSGMAAVTLTGRASVQVVGPVQAGRLLFASGRNDGTALALSPSQITLARLPLLIGRALEAGTGEGIRAVAALVGLPEHAVLSGLLEERDALLEVQEVELAELRAKVGELEPLTAQVADLRRATARLVALEAARQSEQLAPPKEPD